MIGNPELIRLARSRLRPGMLLGRAAIIVLLLGAILAVMYYGGLETRTSVDNIMHSYFFTVAGIQLVVLALFGLSQSSQNVVLEKERNTYDFQRLVTMGPWHLALGKLLGSAIESWWLVACAIPFLGVPCMVGSVPFLSFLQVLLLLVMFGTFIQSAALACSAIAEKTSKASGLVILLGLFFTILALAVSSSTQGRLNLWESWIPFTYLSELSASQGSTLGQATIPFFGWNGLPMAAGCVLVSLYFISIMFCILARRMADPELSLLRPEQAGVFYLLLQVLLLGSIWDRLQTYPSEGLMVFHGVNAMVLLIIPFAVMPSVEILRSRMHRAPRNGHWRIIGEVWSRLQDSPPLVFQLILTAAYVFVALGLTQYALGLAEENLANQTFPTMKKILEFQKGRIASLREMTLPLLVVVSGTGWVAAGLLFYFQIYVEKSAMVLAIALLAACASVPPALVAIFFGPEFTVYVSPVAYLIVTIANLIERTITPVFNDPLARWTLPLIYGVTFVLLALLSAMRIRFLIDLAHLERANRVEEIRSGGSALGGAEEALGEMRAAARRTFGDKE